ncbi:hypothetical protein AZL_018970 [Azospirillum sp. B510]|uniref:hypothetical protein n=1 Tax=Azospirillum sp. (strain B510) TaxID=137722 RepID=UPI0001C4C312|nr:hypothetical protein [Azospirillum sp. B510]BAI72535.1 hypothetical protein AZL_018970 [Azospirillum sp. B510]
MATQQEVGRHLDLSERSVRDLLDRSVLPAARRGALDLDTCRAAYIKHLRAVAAGRSLGPAGDDLTTERARLAREQADAVAIRNAVSRRELLPRSDVTRAVVGAFTIVRDRLSALPARLAGSLAATTDPADARARLETAIADVLAELAETRVVTVEEPADAA